MSSAKPLAIIAGVGGGTGAAVARRFAKSYTVILLARNSSNFSSLVDEITSSGGSAFGVETDISDPTSVHNTFRKIKEKYSDAGVAAAVFNASNFVRKPFLELSLEEFESGWNVSGRGAFNFSSSVLPLLLAHRESSPQHPPSLIFTGATASVKASVNFSSFATSKWALRALSQSLAREFGPQGVHVSHVIVDGVIDIPRTKEWLNDTPDAKISPEALADAYWHLHSQPRTSFTWEIDIRPYIEKW